MKPKKPSKKLIKENAALLARKSILCCKPTDSPLRHELGRLVHLSILRNGPLPRNDNHTWPFSRDPIRNSLEASGVAHQTAQRIGNIALSIANEREHYRNGYSIRLGRYIHGRYPTGTPVALIRRLTLEFIADPLSRYAKIPYCSLKRAPGNGTEGGTEGETRDIAIFASPTYGIKDYNRVEVRLDTPLARQAFATATKLAEKVYNRAKLKQPA